MASAASRGAAAVAGCGAKESAAEKAVAVARISRRDAGSAVLESDLWDDLAENPSIAEDPSRERGKFEA